jgi:GLPGLI family protein
MKYIITAILFFTTLLVQAQSRFIGSGRIEYERKTNQHRSLDTEGDNEWVKEIKKNIPKFVSDIYELHFTAERSVYKLAKENTDNKYLWNGKPSESDVLVQDLNNKKVSIQRDVFEQTYLIQDSARNLEWRITEETREIAGFECRKALTKICDSVYIVAFYTDQILVSSGPESFGGLPGMILGLAVPRLAITWFATKVELSTPSSIQLNPVQKGKKTTWVKLSSDMQKAIKDWGKEGAALMWRFSL